MQDLKVAAWNAFFGATHRNCIERLGDDGSGKEFFASWTSIQALFTVFVWGYDSLTLTSNLCAIIWDIQRTLQGLLASQLLQKLVKNLNAAKINQDTLKYLKGFIDTMHEHSDPPMDLDDGDRQDLIVIRQLVDFSTPPQRVLDLVEQHFSKAAAVSRSQNKWLLAPFTAEKGLRVVEAAKENAKGREAQTTILEELNQKMEQINDRNLLDQETKIVEGNQLSFNKQYGEELKATHVSLSNQNVKHLKGADKQRVADLKTTLQTAVKVVMSAFIAYDLVPFLNSLADASSKREADKIEVCLVKDDMCIIQVQNTVEPKQVAALLDFAKKVQSFAVDLKDIMIGKMDAVRSQKSMEAWNKANCDVLKFFPEDSFLKDAIANLSSSTSPLLQSNASGHASTHILKCVEMALKMAERSDDSQIKDTDAEVKAFFQHVEQASLLSSVMDNGDLLRQGLNILSTLLTCDIRYSGLLREAEGNAEGEIEIGEKELKALALGFQLQLLEEKNQKQVDASMRCVLESCPEVDKPNFGKAIGAQITYTVQNTKHLFERLHETVSALAKETISGCPDLTLPTELSDLSDDDLHKVFASSKTVEKTFATDLLQAASDVAIEAQNIIDRVEWYAKKMDGKTVDDFCEGYSDLKARHRACLAWLCLG